MVRLAFIGCVAVGALAFALGLNSPLVIGGTNASTAAMSLADLLEEMSKRDRIQFENYIKDIVSANCRVVSGQAGGLGTGTGSNASSAKGRINCFDLHTQN